MRTTLPWSRPQGAVLKLTLAAVLAGLLAACASGPKPGAAGSGAAPSPAASPGRDGAEARSPQDLAQVPDAEPRDEAIRSGGPNKPYEVLGRQYVPITQDRSFTERGLASWYGRKFHGRRTANGELYDMYAMSAAHPTLPLPSYARVRNPANGREVVVRINDRGPFHPGRIVDLSYTAALKLDLLRGVAPVELERITLEAIRSGSWRRAAPAGPQRLSAGAAVVAIAKNPGPAAAPVVNEAMPAPSPAPIDALLAGAKADAGVPAPSAAVDAPALPDVAQGSGFWIQLGAFRQRGGAEDFQRRVAAELDWLGDKLAVFSDAALFRLQAGPYASRDEARSAAERIRGALQLVPVVLERR